MASSLMFSFCTKMNYTRSFLRLRSSSSQKLLFSKFSGLGWRDLDRSTPGKYWTIGGVRTAFRKRNNIHANRSRLAPIEDVTGVPDMGLRLLVKPFCFTVLVGGCSFAGAAVWQYENYRQRTSNLWRRGSSDFLLYQRKGIRNELNQWWNERTDGEQVALGIIAANAMVFAAWRVPALRGTMVKYFCSNPNSKVICWPMLLSTFSHYSLWHFMANMYVLYTFSSSIVSIFGKEQFIAFYLTAGTLSSFTSYLHKVTMRIPSMSLGASGAIMAVLASVCVHAPNAQLAIILFPWFTFSAQAALKSLLLLDTTGLILKWHLFDHAAHLGGALFGMGYVMWGHDLVWKKRETVMKWWARITNGPGS